MSDFAQSGYDTFLTGEVGTLDGKIDTVDTRLNGKIDTVDTRLQEIETFGIMGYSAQSPDFPLNTSAFPNTTILKVIVWDHNSAVEPFDISVWTRDTNTGVVYKVPSQEFNGVQPLWSGNMKISLHVAKQGIRVLNNHGDDVNILGSGSRNHFSLFATCTFRFKPDDASMFIGTEDPVPNDMNDNT